MDDQGSPDDDQVDDIFEHALACKSRKTESDCGNKEHLAAVEVINQIKEKFANSDSHSERLLLLTLAPKSWGRRRLAAEFGASERQARKAVQLVKECGILTCPNAKKGKDLDSDTTELILAFYEDDENSRLMPGMKDYVSIRKQDGSREHVQKRLILSNLSELFQLFKSAYPLTKIGFSKFCQLRPQNCVLAGASGTHTVCVCIYHENVDLMLEAVNFKDLTCGTDFPFETYHDIIKIITCNISTPECYLNECKKCPGIENFKESLKTVLADQDIETIKFQSWQQTDRSTLHTIISNVEDFVEMFCDRLKKLRPHSFIAKQQSSYLKHIKQNLKEGEILVTCDFAENYAFVAQKAAQSFHWNNDQITIFTVVFYYKEGNSIGHGSMAIISDNLKHDTVSVYAFQKILIEYLKENFHLNKISYFSDGAAQHFKNKYNFQNLLHHEKDFGVTAEWHFHETAHGKGPCDGVGGNLKRNAMRASLQASSSEQILTCNAFYTWAKRNFSGTKIFFSSKESNVKTAKELEDRFACAKTIPGTQKYHTFIPVSETTIQVKKYSVQSSSEFFPKLRTKSTSM